MSSPTPTPVIIAVAPCGSKPTKSDNPATPYTPREIADEIVRAAQAGAALAHVHARTPQGAPTQDVETFREIIDRVRERSDIIIEVSLGTKGFTADEAMAPLVLKPDGATLPYEAYDQEDEAGVETIRMMAKKMLAAGVRPGLGVLSPGSRRGALALMHEGLAGEAPCAAVSLGAFDTIGQGAERLLHYTQDLPPQCHWWFMKGGAHQLALRAAAMALGGHVRVGFEDSVRTYEGALASSNAVFVDRMVQLAAATGRPVATTAEARDMLFMTSGS
jgi:3-keto-5-aminohexanoate cleavage enzyme